MLMLKIELNGFPIACRVDVEKMSSATPPSEASEWRAIFIIALLVGIFAIAVGGTPVLLSVLLTRQGIGEGVIGISAAFGPLGIVASSFIVPAAAGHFGAVRIAVCSCLTGLAAMAAMAIVPDPIVWIPARAIWGLAVGGFYIVNKAWLAKITPEQHRGRVFGIYASCLSVGFASGPLLFSLADFRAAQCFALLGAAFVLCALGVLMARRHLPDFKETTRAPVMSALPLIPVALLAAASFGAFDHATLAFLPRFGMVYGLSAAAMGIGSSVLNVGNVLLQPVIGTASDRWGRRPVMVCCALLSALGGGLLPSVMGSPLIYPFLFVWGACAYGVTTVALAAISDRFRGSQLLSCSAAMTMAGGLGGVAGPPSIGFLQEAASMNAFPHAVASIFAALAVFAFAFNVVRSTMPRH
jgi:MFS family permease